MDCRPPRPLPRLPAAAPRSAPAAALASHSSLQRSWLGYPSFGRACLQTGPGSRTSTCNPGNLTVSWSASSPSFGTAGPPYWAACRPRHRNQPLRDRLLLPARLSLPAGPCRPYQGQPKCAVSPPAHPPGKVCRAASIRRLLCAGGSQPAISSNSVALRVGTGAVPVVCSRARHEQQPKNEAASWGSHCHAHEQLKTCMGQRWLEGFWRDPCMQPAGMSMWRRA